MFDAKNVLVSTTLVAKVFVHVASEEQVRTFQVQKGLVKKTRITTTATATKSARFFATSTAAAVQSGKLLDTAAAAADLGALLVRA